MMTLLAKSRGPRGDMRYRYSNDNTKITTTVVSTLELAISITTAACWGNPYTYSFFSVSNV